MANPFSPRLSRHLIGLIGLLGTGKDTIAEQMVNYRNRFIIDRHAEPLKLAALSVFGLSFDNRDEKEKKRMVPVHTAEVAALACCAKVLGLSPDMSVIVQQRIKDVFSQFQNGLYYHMSPRLFQQYLGTEIIRHYDENAFVNYLHAKADKTPNFITLAPDVRFHNELAERNILVVREDFIPPVRPEHASESMAYELTMCVLERKPFPDYAKDKVFFVVRNDYGLDGAYAVGDSLAETLLRD